MTRPAREQPIGSHLATLTRMLRQIDASKRLAEEKKKAVKVALGDALTLLQSEVINGHEKEGNGKAAAPRKVLPSAGARPAKGRVKGRKTRV